jgi:drug/metabolite transporter (DMT)-like permease
MALGAALALTASVVWGTQHFLAGFASRQIGAVTVTLIIQGAGFLILLPALLVFPAPASPQALIWGGLAGITAGSAPAFLYAAMRRGMMAVVSPISSVVAAGLPVIVGILQGERPPIQAWAGVGCGLVAVALTSWGDSDIVRRRSMVPVLLAIAAGIGFATFFIFTAHAPHDSGLWPVTAARMSTVILIVFLVARQGITQPARSFPLRLALLSGLLDATGGICYLLAVRHADLAVVAVLASLTPVMILALSMGILGERLRRRQLVGAGLALTAVGLIAA